MSIPPNPTPETAIAITALPYSLTLNVDEAPDSDAAYTPSCSSDLRHGVWFKYTPPTGRTAIGLDFRASVIPSNYFPVVSVWTGTPGSLTQVFGVCLETGAQIGKHQISVTPGTTYYFQVTDAGGEAVAGADLVFAVTPDPNENAPAGALLISNDTPNFPTAILDPTDGSILRVLGLPSFECADILPDGTMAVMAEEATADLYATAVKLYDASLTLIKSVTSIIRASQDPVSPIRSNGSDTFYVASAINSSTQVVVSTLNAAGDVGATTWTLPTNGNRIQAMAPSRDDAILYYGGSADSAIHRYDLVNSEALTDLVADIGSNARIGRDMYVLADGSLLVVFYTGISTVEVRRYDTADGTLLNTYTLGTTLGSSPRIALGLDDPDTFRAMTFPTGTGNDATNKFQLFDVETEAVLSWFEVPQKNAAVNWNVLFGPSQSCPLLVLPLAVAAPTINDSGDDDGSDGGGGDSGDEECECCMATKLGVINGALMKLGVSKLLTNAQLTANTSREAIVGNLAYAAGLKETLRRTPWPFATKYADSADAGSGEAMELVDGDGETPVNGDWMYAYRYPSDCVMARRILPAGAAGTGRQFNPDPVPFRVGRTTEFGADADYLLLFTNLEDAVLEYTALVECREDFADALFEDALEWRIASKMAPSLDRTDKTARECLAIFEAMFDTAAAVAHREGQLEKDGDANWISGR